jgi:hypothetical protein
MHEKWIIASLTAGEHEEVDSRVGIYIGTSPVVSGSGGTVESLKRT